jgi:hypothetical protein
MSALLCGRRVTEIKELIGRLAHLNGFAKP